MPSASYITPSKSSNESAHASEKKDNVIRDVPPAEKADAIIAEETVATLPQDVTKPLQDGGLRAWLQVAGSFLVFSALWGMPFAYGTFQSYYELQYLPDSSASSIAWVGTVSTFFLILGGVASGPLFDWGYYRTMLIAGAFIETLAVFLLSLCQRYWQIFLVQGVLLGIGNALLYIPGLALVGRSFKKNRGIALALTTCGAPVGSIIYTLVFAHLIDRLGFGWTVRVMGFVMLASYLIAFPLILFRVRNIGDIASGTARKLFDKDALTDGPFWVFTSSSVFIFMGYIMPFIFFASYGQSTLGMSETDALNVIVVSQAASVVGRLGAGLASTRVGVMTPWTFCVTASGVSCIAWIAVTTPAGLYAIAAFYGAFSGALIPLPTAIFPLVCPDPKVMGARLGMSQGVSSFGTLIGAPIAGALVGINGVPAGNPYLGLQLFGGCIILVGALNLLLLWWMLYRQRDVPTVWF